ncbi:MAG: NADH:ubiquinone oxidoreductase subunit NDUFA12 [Pseudomonadota bacterium]
MIKRLFRFLGVLSPVAMIATKILSRAKYVGEDTYGNQYYVAAPRKGQKRERRFVIYKEEVEASAIPPEWHGWMHHQTNDIPSKDDPSFRRKWQKPHKPNMTGTNKAYRPPGHILKGGERPKATGDYEAWTPPE